MQAPEAARDRARLARCCGRSRRTSGAARATRIAPSSASSRSCGCSPRRAEARRDETDEGSARERRLDEKRRRGDVKRLRRPPPDEEPLPPRRAAATRASAAGTSCASRASRASPAAQPTESTVASRSSAIATPNPICWNLHELPEAKPANTATMIIAAPVMIRAVDATPHVTASRVEPLTSYRSLDPAHEEHLVVDREPEQDREQEERHLRIDDVRVRGSRRARRRGRRGR